MCVIISVQEINISTGELNGFQQTSAACVLPYIWPYAFRKWESSLAVDWAALASPPPVAAVFLSRRCSEWVFAGPPRLFLYVCHRGACHTPYTVLHRGPVRQMSVTLMPADDVEIGLMYAHTIRPAAARLRAGSMGEIFQSAARGIAGFVNFRFVCAAKREFVTCKLSCEPFTRVSRCKLRWDYGLSLSVTVEACGLLRFICTYICDCQASVLDSFALRNYHSYYNHTVLCFFMYIYYI